MLSSILVPPENRLGLRFWGLKISLRMWDFLKVIWESYTIAYKASWVYLVLKVRQKLKVMIRVNRGESCPTWEIKLGLQGRISSATSCLDGQTPEAEWPALTWGWGGTVNTSPGERRPVLSRKLRMDSLYLFGLLAQGFLQSSDSYLYLHLKDAQESFKKVPISSPHPSRFWLSRSDWIQLNQSCPDDSDIKSKWKCPPLTWSLCLRGAECLRGATTHMVVHAWF